MFGTGDGGRLDQQGTDDPGLAGSALWFRGPGNRVRFNVGANAYGAGPYQWAMNTYCHFLQTSEFGTVMFQTAVGQDRSAGGEARKPGAQNFLQHEGNYLFSCSGLHTAWSISTWADTIPGFDGIGGTVDDLMGWNSYGYGIFLYEHHQVTHRKNVILVGSGGAQELLANDYRITEVAFEDCLIEGYSEMPSYTGTANCTASTPDYGTASFTNCIFNQVGYTTLHGNGGGMCVPGREITLDSCVFFHATSTLIMSPDNPATGRQDVRDIAVVLHYRRDFDDAGGDSFKVQPTYRPALDFALPDRDEISGNLFAFSDVYVPDLGFVGG
jgi:hypothetical protein